MGPLGLMEPTLKYHPCLVGTLTCGSYPARGQCQAGSLTGLGLEHRWIDENSAKEGFIDLIIGKKINDHFSYYMVIECKRFGGGSWVFLNYDENNFNDSILSTRYKGKNDRKIIWERKNYFPESMLSSFCAVPGQNNKDTPMLERISEKLLNALESVALKKLLLDCSNTDNNLEYQAQFIPVIVTNAELISCNFKPVDVDLLSGSLSKDKTKFENIPFVRFQKTFSTSYDTGTIPMNLIEANKDSERTIWIVHAQGICNFLRQWEDK